jgi:hypothetical protein
MGEAVFNRFFIFQQLQIAAPIFKGRELDFPKSNIFKESLSQETQSPGVRPFMSNKTQELKTPAPRGTAIFKR